MSGLRPVAASERSDFAELAELGAAGDVAAVLARALQLATEADPADRGALHTAAVAAVQAARDDTPADAHPAAELVVAELRDGGGRPDAELLRAAARIGLRLGEPHAGAVVEYDGPQHRAWVTAVAWLGRPARVEGGRAWLIVGPDADVELTDVRRRLEATMGVGRVRAACGPLGTGVAPTRPSFADAELLLVLLRGRPGRMQQSFDAAGLDQLLLAVPPERLRSFVAQHLGPILDRPDLLETLRFWLASNGSRIAVAAQLHLHRNSVGYRVGQIKQLLGVDPLEPRVAGILHAALGARELLGGLAELTELDAAQLIH